MLTAIRKTTGYMVAVVLAASVFLFGVVAAFGDSYTVSVVTHTQNENFVGIDAAGDFVVNVSNSLMNPGSSCGGVMGAMSCFETYYAGQQGPVFSTVAPGLVWDNGATCTVGALSGVCNNGHQLVGGYLGGVKGVWAGIGSLTEILPGGSFDGGYMNSFGDAVFIDGSDDTLVSVMDTPTVGLRSLIEVSQPVPEPQSVWLVGLGMLASTMFLIRRRAHCRVEARRVKR